MKPKNPIHAVKPMDPSKGWSMVGGAGPTGAAAYQAGTQGGGYTDKSGQAMLNPYTTNPWAKKPPAPVKAAPKPAPVAPAPVAAAPVAEPVVAPEPMPGPDLATPAPTTVTPPDTLSMPGWMRDLYASGWGQPQGLPGYDPSLFGGQALDDQQMTPSMASILMNGSY